MSLTDPSNIFLRYAQRFVNQTSQHIFLTGKAGTGKTTFLKYIRENSFKKMAIIAPTGVAAINAGGVTMHSFFQLPFGPFLPVQNGWHGHSGVNEYTLIKNIRFNQAKRELLRELDLIVIDEVSMLRADMLDAIDSILRHFRGQSAPFGGVQILYIGDLYQLPPVVNRTEWETLRQFYKSPFFFDALVLQKAPALYLELKKIYRQDDADFINILNNIRHNQVTAEDLSSLHKHYNPSFQPKKEENYITLTTHNARADQINQQELAKLPGNVLQFEGEVKGDFDEKALPAEKILLLKEGAQIMFTKNDKGENRKYFNGKIGIINRIDAENKIFIKFPGEKEELLLEKETWKNIRYQYNREEGRVEEETIGTFIQYPLRLAWAITIHKSQGLTFDKAIIDAGASFAPGQVYVALSRLTSIDGLVLYSKISYDAIQTDPRIVHFALSEMSEEQLHEHFKKEQKTFILQSLYQSFNWEKITTVFRENDENYDDRKIPDKYEAIMWSKNIFNIIRQQHEVSVKFSRQLDHLLPMSEQDNYINLHQRISAACDYFIQSLDQCIKLVKQHIAEVKMKLKVKLYVKELRELEAVLSRKKLQLQHAMDMATALRDGTDMDDIWETKEQADEPADIGQPNIKN